MRNLIHGGLTLILGLALIGCGGSKPRVVLYSAQDPEFAEKILDDFTTQTGVRVDPKFDTEADKSVSLYVELLAEKDRPRCDVFWNNEILSTIRLQKQGLLEPYASPSAKGFPAECRGPDDTWHAFAARARIIIINTELVKEADRPKSLLDLTDPRWKGQVAMARPQFGTTATQAACLFEVLGTERARQFYRDLKANDVRVVPGNKQVAEKVGEGHLPGRQRIALGVTDTDDALEEIEAGHPVAILFPDRDGNKDNPRLGTLFIPHTVSIIRGCPNLEHAKKLVDFLLSEEMETQLAEGGAHQIPLNPNVHAKLPPQMETPRTVKSMQVDFRKAAEMWDEVQMFLRDEFAR